MLEEELNFAEKKQTLFVIDAMPLLYRGHFVFLQNPRLTSKGINTSALFAFVSSILHIIEKFAPTHIVLAFDSRTPTFRREMFPDYKAQRPPTPPDIVEAIPQAEEFARAMNIPALRVDGFEADDLMGTIAARASKNGTEVYLATGDKDIAQLVDENTRLYRFGRTGADSASVWSRAEVCEHWGISAPEQMVDLLALAGDTSDNIPGVRGIGEKTAVNLLREYGSLDRIIEKAAEIKGKLGENLRGGLEDAKMSRTLATIRRDVPLDFKIEDCERRAPDGELLADFLEKYEFRAIAKKLNVQKISAAKSETVPEAAESLSDPLRLILDKMEKEGIKIDTAALEEVDAKLKAELADYEKRIFDAAGEEFNINSPKQLGEILFGKMQLDPKAKRTATGNYSTSEEVLQKHIFAAPIIADILEYREIAKLISTYVEKLPRCINPETGRVHTHFAQNFAETGRLISRDPNLQNIPVRSPRGKLIRAAFIARDENHLLLSADYSQIELRIMAALSGDAAMCAAFAHGADIHTETAARVFDIMPALVTPEMRSRCKAVNFGIIYGISAFGLAQQLRIARKEAARMIEEYFKQYPGVKEFMTKAVEDARAKGYAETLLGHRRAIPELAAGSAMVRAAAERIAVNTPVQGTAADIIKLAMIKIDEMIQAAGLNAKMILQIHDELLFDAPKDEIETLSKLVKEAMTNAVELPGGVPLEVDVGIGETWLAAH